MTALSPLPILADAELQALAAIHADPRVSLPDGQVPLDMLRALHAAGVLMQPDYYIRDRKPWPVSRRGLLALRAACLIPPVPPIACVAAELVDDGFRPLSGALVQDWRLVHDACPIAVPEKGAVAPANWTHVFRGHDGPSSADWYYLVRLPEKRMGARARISFREPHRGMMDVEGLTGQLCPCPFPEPCASTGAPNSPYVWFRVDPLWNCYHRWLVTRLDRLEFENSR